jgi:phage virion morphogenesis protein
VAGVKIGLDLDGAVGGLERMALPVIERLGNLEPVLRTRAALLDGVIQTSFRQSKSPLGEAWKALAPSTVASRRKGSSKPLVDTGEMRQSITIVAGKDRITFGISGAPQQYGPVHQFGTSRAGRKRNVTIPRRAFLPIDKSGETAFTTGAAKRWFDGTAEAIVEYVMHGKK